MLSDLEITKARVVYRLQQWLQAWDELPLPNQLEIRIDTILEKDLLKAVVEDFKKTGLLPAWCLKKFGRCNWDAEFKKNHKKSFQDFIEGRSDSL